MVRMIALQIIYFGFFFCVIFVAFFPRRKERKRPKVATVCNNRRHFDRCLPGVNNSILQFVFEASLISLISEAKWAKSFA